MTSLFPGKIPKNIFPLICLMRQKSASTNWKTLALVITTVDQLLRQIWSSWLIYLHLCGSPKVVSQHLCILLYNNFIVNEWWHSCLHILADETHSPGSGCCWSWHWQMSQIPIDNRQLKCFSVVFFASVIIFVCISCIKLILDQIQTEY